MVLEVLRVGVFQHRVQVVLVLGLEGDLNDGETVSISSCLDSSLRVLALESLDVLVKANADTLIEMVFFLLEHVGLP